MLSVARIDIVLACSCCAAYRVAAALSDTDTDRNMTPFLALLSTGVNGTPPMTDSFLRPNTGYEPPPPVSVAPSIAVTCLPTSWLAQRADVAGVPSVAHVTSLIG